MKHLITLLLLTISLSAFSQYDHRPYLKNADRKFEHDSLTTAYSLYSALWNTDTFPDIELKMLAARLQKTRNKIDSLRTQAEDFIERTNSNLRFYEAGVLEKTIQEDEIKWNKKIIAEYFEYDKHIDSLNLAYYGLIQLPEKLTEIKNLKSIDLRGNFYLDSAQVYGILNKCENLKEIKIDPLQKIAAKDTVNYLLLDTLRLRLKKLTENHNITHESVKSLIGQAWEFYQKGQYTTAIFRLQQANASQPEYRDELKPMQNIILESIELTQLKLNNERAYSARIKDLFDIEIFDRAAQNINPDFATCKNFTEADFLKIDSLDFSGIRIKELPEQLTKCKNLKHINLLGNREINWQASNKIFKQLTDSVGIYVSVNDLSDIDSSYWKLITGIEVLKNELNKIPENILKQKQLVYLDLSGEMDNNNYFQKLPAKLFGLKNLTYFDIKFCNIDSLPPEIGQLKNLTQLNLWDNQLSSLPTEIEQLKNLKELDLGSNKLRSLPKEIGQLNNLKELDLMWNKLKGLPKEIGQLTNLTKLDLRMNKLSSLPQEIGQLNNLTQLNLWDNQLSSLPNEIGQLTNLTQLDLRGNKLSNLPPEIGQLKNLMQLDLRGNKLSSLPPKIGQLTNLTELPLSSNELSSLPKEIGQLKNLTYLDLAYSQLGSLPKEIGQLKNLTYLSLGSNKLISLPKEIGQLTNLTGLDLNSNQLSSLPKEIGQLTNLTELGLWGNQLSSLPKEIGQLTNLTKLDLGNNIFPAEEQKKIEKLLPNCNIDWL